MSCQTKYNRRHRSIYGLSYDLYGFDIISRIMMLYVTLQYEFSPLIRSQLADRFPLFYPMDGDSVAISVPLLVGEVIVLLVNYKALTQLFRYRRTKHTYQGFSALFTFLLILGAVFHVFTFACSTLYLPDKNMGKFGVFYLEHLNYIWVNAQAFQCVKYVPQLSLNWMGMCTTGVSSKFVLISLLSSVIGILSHYIGFPDKSQFYLIPWNSYPLFVFICQAISVILLLYQSHFIYANRSPYLPRGS